MQSSAETSSVPLQLRALEDTLDGLGPCAVAVSGGVDSMTLAVVKWGEKHVHYGE